MCRLWYMRFIVPEKSNRDEGLMCTWYKKINLIIKKYMDDRKYNVCYNAHCIKKIVTGKAGYTIYTLTKDAVELSIAFFIVLENEKSTCGLLMEYRI